MEQIVDTVGRFGKFENILPRLDSIATEFDSRSSRRLLERIADDMKKKFLSVTKDFYLEAESVICKYLPDMDSNEFVKNIESNVNVEIEDDSIFKSSDEGVNEETSFLDVLGSLYRGVAGASFGLSEVLMRGISHDSDKNYLLDEINKLRTNFNAQEYIDVIYKGHDRVVETIKKQIFDNLVTPLQDIISECRNDLSQKEERLNTANNKKDEITSSLNSIKEQIASMNTMV